MSTRPFPTRPFPTPPMNTPPMGGGWDLFGSNPYGPGPEPDGIRVGDAERDQAVNLLGEHYAAGRLDQQEFQERADQALQATLSSELDPLFADLPADPQSQAYGTTYEALSTGGPSQAARFGGNPAGWPPPPPALLLVPLVLGGLFVLSALMHAPWFLIGLIWLAVVFGRGRGPFGHHGRRGQGHPARNRWQERESAHHWSTRR